MGTDDEDESEPEPTTPLAPGQKLGYDLNGNPKAWIEKEDEPEPDSIDGQFFRMETADLIETMGISGMSLICRSNNDFFELIMIAIQSFLLQYTILFQFANVTYQAYVRAQETRTGEELPLSWMQYAIFFVCIHLHFLSCMGDIPFSLNILLHISDIHDTPKELLLAAPIFFTDAIITPILQLIIGAIFMCTSNDAVEVLMNSCAVAFISNIDNWILTLLRHMKTLSGSRQGITVHVPFNEKFSKFMEYAVCVVPVLPILFSIIILEIGRIENLLPEGKATGGGVHHPHRGHITT